MQTNVKKLTVAGVLVAVGVACSTFSIPVGASRCFPIQHMVNVIAGVLLGPLYACTMAFCTSLLRVLLGTGSLLAALCCGLCYKASQKLPLAYLGEIIGTGVLGGMACYPIATLVMGKEAALFTYVPAFLLSTAVGATISILAIGALQKTRVLGQMKLALGRK